MFGKVCYSSCCMQDSGETAFNFVTVCARNIDSSFALIQMHHVRKQTGRVERKHLFVLNLMSELFWGVFCYLLIGMRERHSTGISLVLTCTFKIYVPTDAIPISV